MLVYVMQPSYQQPEGRHGRRGENTMCYHCTTDGGSLHRGKATERRLGLCSCEVVEQTVGGRRRMQILVTVKKKEEKRRKKYKIFEN